MTEQSKVPDHPELERLEYECDDLGVTLVCFFEYTPEELGSREPLTGLQMEPDYPATYSLLHVYTPEGLDIAPVMAIGLIDEIEVWGADKFEEQAAQDSAEAAYDRWLASQ